MTDQLEQQLRVRGAKFRAPGDEGHDLRDVRRRMSRQRRDHRVVAGTAAALVAMAVGSVMVGRHRSGYELQTGGPAPAAPNQPAPDPTGSIVPVSPDSSVPTVTFEPYPTGSTDPAGARVTTAGPSTTTTTHPAATPVERPASDAQGGNGSVAHVPSGQGPAPTSGLAPTAEIHTVDFRNFTYAPDSCAVPEEAPVGGYVVRDGRVDLPTGTYRYLEVSGAPVLGDVTGDGRDEAIVTVSCSTGASASWAHSWLYTGDATDPSGARRLAKLQGPAFAAPDELGNIYDVTVAGGVVTSRWLLRAAGDPMHGPSKIATQTQRWTGAGWQNVKPVEIAPRSDTH